MTRTFARRTALSASMTRRELASGANNHPAALKGVGAALAGLYLALHGLRVSVHTEVCTQTDTRFVRLEAGPGGPVYAAEAETRFEAAMLLIDDLTAALKAGKPFGELVAS